MDGRVERVQLEMRLRGWSARRCAQESTANHFTISNQTWSEFLKTGTVTDGVRSGVVAAFNWPLDWAEELPAVTLYSDEVVKLRGEVVRLRRAVSLLAEIAHLDLSHVLGEQPAETSTDQ